MITETQSSAFDIRDAFYNAVTPDPFWTGFTLRKTKMLPVQPALIPYLGIYLVDEGMSPDGDPNAGMVRFSHSARVGFSVIVANNDDNAGESTVDQGYMTIMRRLWCDQHVMNVLVNSNPEGVGIESALRGTRRHNFGVAGARNETPFVELQYEVSTFFRSEWYPDITDTLDEIVVTTGIKATDTPEERAQREQVEVVYDFTATTKAPRRFPLAKPWLPAREQSRRIIYGQRREQN